MLEDMLHTDAELVILAAGRPDELAHRVIHPEIAIHFIVSGIQLGALAQAVGDGQRSGSIIIRRSTGVVELTLAIGKIGHGIAKRGRGPQLPDILVIINRHGHGGYRGVVGGRILID